MTSDRPKSASIIAGATLLLACSFLTGAANGAPAAVPADPRFAAIDKITLLPVVMLAELREGDRKRVAQVIEEQLPLELALKGYALAKTEVFSPSASHTVDEIAAMSEAELTRLGPAEDRYILLCVLNAVSSKYFVVANVGNSQMAAVLIDKHTAQVLWSNKIDKSSSINWINTPLILIPMINSKALATYNAFRELFKTLPARE